MGKVVAAFPESRLIDRRDNPVVGYHAVHVVIRDQAQSYELQIRTEAQQRWAQLSEKIADLVGFGIKYGDGPTELTKMLTSSGRLIYLREVSKRQRETIIDLDRQLLELDSQHIPEQSAEELRAEIAAENVALEEDFNAFKRLIDGLEEQRTS